jgi:hypothetical protein
MNVDLGVHFSSLWASVAMDIEYSVDGGRFGLDEGELVFM